MRHVYSNVLLTAFAALMIATPAQAALLYDSGVSYASTDGGFTLFDNSAPGSMTGMGFSNSHTWNIQSIVIIADVTFDFVSTSAKSQVGSSPGLATQQSMGGLPITVGPVIATRFGLIESRQITIDVGSLIVPAGSHYLGLGISGTGTFVGWAGYNLLMDPLDRGSIYSTNGGVSWIGAFPESHAVFAIHGQQVTVPEPGALFLLGISVLGLHLRPTRHR